MLKTSTRTFFVCMAFAALALAGCASHGNKSASEAYPAPAASSENSGIQTTPQGQEQTLSKAQKLKKQAEQQHSIYFAFDSDAIKPQYQAVISAWAEYLLAVPTVQVQIQGNTDERGTRAYNQALGERRAVAVQDALEAQGVPASQLSTTSFGKERPVCTEHAESCWKLNRRADLVRQ